MAFDRDFHQKAIFDVEIEGVSVAKFTKVKIPDIEVETVEYWDGRTKHAHKRPGNVKYGDIELSHGYASDTTLQDWWHNIQKGVQDRKSCSIVMYDEEDTEVKRWNFYECWPKKWSVGELDGKANEISVEVMTLNTEFMEHG